MKLLSIALALAWPGMTLLPGQELPKWVLSLSKIKRQTKAELERLPNYACQETVNRFRRAPNAPSFKPVDTLHLEVAFIGGKEMFAPAGAAQFQDVDLSAFALEGAIGTGAFSVTARNLFVNDSGRITGWGEEKIADRATLWYTYEIAGMYQPLTLQSGGVQTTVGERGRFWVDAGSLELLRIEDHALEIPEYMGMRDVTTAIDYSKVQIGPILVLMPRVAETVITSLNGKEDKNIAEFSGCREYGSESVIRFGPDEPDSKPPAAPKKK